MIAIINRRKYDTDTSELVLEYWNGLGRNDFNHCYEDLYLTKKGSWFLHARGGALTTHGVSYADGMGAGEHILPMDADEAIDWLEAHDGSSEIEEYFPNSIEDA